MNQYIITEEQLKTILERRGAIYISCQGKFRDEIVKEVCSHPYNPQAEELVTAFTIGHIAGAKAEREKVLDKLLERFDDDTRYNGWYVRQTIQEILRQGGE